MPDEPKDKTYDELLSEYKALKRPEPVKIPEAAAPAPVSEPMSFGGFAKNIWDDAGDTVKGLANAIIHAYPNAIKGGMDIYHELSTGGRQAVIDHPDAFLKSLKDTGGKLVDAVTEPYREHPTTFWYHRPVGTLLDALTLVDLGAGGVKAMGKMAGADAERLAAKLASGEKLTTAEKMLKAGNSLQEAPRKLAGKTGDAIYKKVFKVDRQKTKQILGTKSEEAAQAAGMANQVKQGFKPVFDALSDADKENLDTVLNQGTTAAFLDTNPKVAAARQAWENEVTRQQDIYERRGLLTRDQMQNAVIKKIALDNGIETDAAKAMYDAAEVKPLYAPWEDVNAKGLSVENILDMPPESRLGKVGRLEALKGGLERVKDPTVYLNHAVEKFYRNEGNLRWMDRMIQNPEMVAGPGKAGMVNIYEGEKALQTKGIYSRYFDDNARVASVITRELVAKHGWEEAKRLMEFDPGTIARMKRASTLVADPALARILRYEFTQQGGPIGAFLKVYDRMISLFKGTATVLNPKWYLGNIVGDAVLTELAGVTLGDAKLAKNVMDVMPHRVRGMNDIASREGFFEKFHTLTDFVNGIDNAARQGILTHQLRNKLVNAGTRFYELEPKLRTVLQQSIDYGQALVDRQNLYEQAARSVPKLQEIDKQIAKLQAQLGESQVAMSKYRNKSGLADEIMGKMGDTAEAGHSAAEVKAQLSKLEKFYADLKPESAEVGSVVEQRLAQMGPEIEKEIASKGGQIPGGRKLKTPEAQRQMRGELQNVVTERYRQKLTQEVYEQLKTRTEEHIADLENQFESFVGQGQGIKETPLGSIPKTKGQIGAAGKSDAALKASNEVRMKLDQLQDLKKSMQADFADHMMKSGRLSGEMPELAKSYELTRDAVESANMFLGEYNALDPFEKGVMKRIIPFYTFNKAMAALAFKLPFLAPGTTFMWNRYANFMAKMTQDPDLPDWLAGYFPVMTRANGDTVWMKFSSFSPVNGVGTSEIGGIPIPKLLEFWTANPLISVTLKMIGMKTVFDHNTIPYGEPMVSMGNGDVYEFTEDGKIKKTIPQAPAISAILHTIPLTQLIERIITPFEIGEHNAVGIPIAARNPDGSVKYPKALMDRLIGAFGPSMTSRSKEDLKRSEIVKTRRAIEDLKATYRRSDPDRQEMIKQTIQDYQNGERFHHTTRD